MARKHRREAKSASERAHEILEIKPGAMTVYTAYLVVCIRLIVLVAHSVLPDQR